MSRAARIRIGAAVLATILIVSFAAREFRDQRNRGRAYPVIHELGGRIGSIPCWPLGDEISITFSERSFTRNDLRRLSVLEPLTGRHWVGVAFRDTNLTDDDLDAVHEIIPHCVLLRVVDGQTAQVVAGSR